jgi:hypothetical protein
MFINKIKYLHLPRRGGLIVMGNGEWGMGNGEWGMGKNRAAHGFFISPSIFMQGVVRSS